MNVLKAVGNALSAINPIKVGEKLMATAVKNMLLSALKGVLATLVAALVAFTTTTPATSDALTVMLWGLLINGVHALITFLQHLANPVPAAPKA